MLPTLTDNTKAVYLHKTSRRSVSVYWCVVGFVLLSMAALPFIKVSISVKARGVIRPLQERTEVHATASGIIDHIFFKEGDTVKKGDLILTLKDYNSPSRLEKNSIETQQRKDFIQDLTVLTQAAAIDRTLLDKLKTDLYKQQVRKLIGQVDEQSTLLEKARRDVEQNKTLVADRIITIKEFNDLKTQAEKQEKAIISLTNDQQTVWEQELSRLRLEAAQLKEQLNQIHTDKGFYEVRAPQNGVVQNINTKYTGGWMQVNDLVCSISPDGAMIAESYVDTKSIGLIKPNNEALFQLDAFDYNYFGTLKGTVYFIEKDFVQMDNKPMFRVRATLNSNVLTLRNGFVANLTKGLTYQVRFVITQRTLWQLLFDKLNNWLSPIANKEVTT